METLDKSFTEGGSEEGNQPLSDTDGPATANPNQIDDARNFEIVIDQIVKDIPRVGTQRIIDSEDHEKIAHAYHQLLNRGLPYEKLLTRAMLSPQRFLKMRKDETLPYRTYSDGEQRILAYCEEILTKIPKFVEGSRRHYSIQQIHASVVCNRLYRRTMIEGASSKIVEISGIGQPQVSKWYTERTGRDILELLKEAFPEVEFAQNNTVEETSDKTHDSIISTLDETPPSDVPSNTEKAGEYMKVVAALREQIDTIQKQVNDVISLLAQASGAEINETALQAMESQIIEKLRTQLMQILTGRQSTFDTSNAIPVQNPLSSSNEGRMEFLVPGGVRIVIHHPLSGKEATSE